MNKRLMQFIEYLGITIVEFENKIGCGKTTILKNINLNTELTTKNLKKIKEAYPDLNLNWLVSGNEPMLCSDIEYIQHNNAQNKELSQLNQKIEAYMADVKSFEQKSDERMSILFSVIEKILKTE